MTFESNDLRNFNYHSNVNSQRQLKVSAFARHVLASPLLPCFVLGKILILELKWERQFLAIKLITLHARTKHAQDSQFSSCFHAPPVLRVLSHIVIVERVTENKKKN